MKRSANRILTTHVGSLARPKDLLEMMDARLRGKPHDNEAYVTRVRSAVAEVVRKQVECGVDIVTDGEQGKASFNAYVVERLNGFEPIASSEERITARMKLNEAQAFPEYYEKYFADHMCGVGPNQVMACTGPITYKGELCQTGRARKRDRRWRLWIFLPNDIYAGSSSDRRVCQVPGGNRRCTDRDAAALGAQLKPRQLA
jgi:methionine synthase II (cobalamin-independent)